MARHKRDPKAFDNVWSVMLLAMERYCKEPGVGCTDYALAKQRVWEAYKEFNQHCSQRYMADHSKPLNQRKIAACYAQAIISARPLDIDYANTECLNVPRVDGRNAYERRPCFANERLAIHVACSILVSYLEAAIKDSRCGLTEEESARASRCLEKGVDLLQDVDAGGFLFNLEKTLSLTSIDGTYNTPLLACLFAYWESKVLPPQIYRKVLRVFALVSEEDS